MGKAYTGIDIGGSSIKLAVCKDGVVSQIVTEALPQGVAAEGAVVSREAMADFIKDLVRRTGGIAKDVALVLPSADCLVRTITLPAMTKKELALNLPYEFRDYIATCADRYLYDYAVLGTKNTLMGEPESMDLLVVACPKQAIEDYTHMMRRAGLRLRVALPEQAAMQNLVSDEFGAAADCCILDLTHLSTKLHFFAGGRYDIMRTIDLGGIDIDRAIAQERGIDEHIAATHRQSNFEDAQHCASAVAVYESIATEVGRALNFYAFNNPQTAIETVYCCGGGTRIAPLMETLKTQVNAELLPISAIMAQAGANAGEAVLCPAAVGATMNRE